MATGRGNQLTKQIGEYLVAAELGRRGYVAATFSGNVPDYDIIATDQSFRSVPVQVKAIKGKSWQLDFAKFAKIRLEGKKQIIEQPLMLPRPIACVMVALGKDYGRDHFYILEWQQLRDVLVEDYQANLLKRDGIRPKRFDSFHIAINESHLADYHNKWSLIDELCQRVD